MDSSTRLTVHARLSTVAPDAGSARWIVVHATFNGTAADDAIGGGGLPTADFELDRSMGTATAANGATTAIPIIQFVVLLMWGLGVRGAGSPADVQGSMTLGTGHARS